MNKNKKLLLSLGSIAAIAAPVAVVVACGSDKDNTSPLEQKIQALDASKLGINTAVYLKGDVTPEIVVAALNNIDGISGILVGDVEVEDDSSGGRKITIKNHGADKVITLTGFAADATTKAKNIAKGIVDGIVVFPSIPNEIKNKVTNLLQAFTDAKNNAKNAIDGTNDAKAIEGLIKKDQDGIISGTQYIEIRNALNALNLAIAIQNLPATLTSATATTNHLTNLKNLLDTAATAGNKNAVLGAINKDLNAINDDFAIATNDLVVEAVSGTDSKNRVIKITNHGSEKQITLTFASQ